jgi:hypothetical protein
VVEKFEGEGVKRIANWDDAVYLGPQRGGRATDRNFKFRRHLFQGQISTVRIHWRCRGQDVGDAEVKCFSVDFHWNLSVSPLSPTPGRVPVSRRLPLLNTRYRLPTPASASPFSATPLSKAAQ